MADLLPFQTPDFDPTNPPRVPRFDPDDNKLDMAAYLASRNEGTLGPGSPPALTKAQKIAALLAGISGPFLRYPDGRVDCTWNHPRHGPIPFTADPDDVEEHGRLIHEGILAIAGVVFQDMPLDPPIPPDAPDNPPE